MSQVGFKNQKEGLPFEQTLEFVVIAGAALASQLHRQVVHSLAAQRQFCQTAAPSLMLLNASCSGSDLRATAELSSLAMWM